MDPDLHAQILAAVEADRETVRRLVCDMPPDTEFVADYVTDLEERCLLFDELRQMHRQLNRSPPNAATLGFVMVAPISEIRVHISTFQTTGNPWIWASATGPEASWAIGAYIPKPRVEDPPTSLPMAASSAILNEPGMPIPADQVKRSGAAARDAKERDGNACLFSGTSDPVAAHIFPFATSEKKEFGSLAGILQAFWGAKKAMTWRRDFEDARITQSPKNYLSLGHQIHFWFDNARFALKPLRQIQDEIVVQWHWLKRSRLLPRTEIGHAQDTFLALAGLNDLTWGSCLAHRRSGVPIQTGQTFVIRAKNHKDLPSFELLELQWNLLRVAAICGAADVADASYYDLDDDEVAHLVTSGRDETVTTRQSEAVTKAPEGPELGHTGSPSEQVEQTLPLRHKTHAAKASRNG
ncbi:hypothetical protein C8A01DRAFT_17963 [Parachaetomium inaequale]|uniref:HNH nuclease domain-containing protein n=1 Tax=Parachaetomium inaequale TaxID=2588326 RepID=A0AAN6SPW5_9PEZI|nr:hypothetical protein C8A01DRAFT_17963 [Parachaetomium inaequale]